MIIVLEGIDGAGKSTVAKALQDRLSAMGRKATVVHFPTPDFTKWRDNGKAHTKFEIAQKYIDEMAHVYDMWKSRHITDPARYDILIADRWWYSTAVYTITPGVDRGELSSSEGLELYKSISAKLSCKGEQFRAFLLEPDDVAICMERAKGTDDFDRADAQEYENRAKLYRYFMKDPDGEDDEQYTDYTARCMHEGEKIPVYFSKGSTPEDIASIITYQIGMQVYGGEQ